LSDVFPSGKAEHIVYLVTTGEEEFEWWITDEVLGGVIKY
jgi:hypothetical protein